MTYANHCLKLVVRLTFVRVLFERRTFVFFRRFDCLSPKSRNGRNVSAASLRSRRHQKLILSYFSRSWTLQKENDLYAREDSNFHTRTAPVFSDRKLKNALCIKTPSRCFLRLSAKDQFPIHRHRGRPVFLCRNEPAGF